MCDIHLVHITPVGLGEKGGTKATLQATSQGI